MTLRESGAFVIAGVLLLFLVSEVRGDDTDTGAASSISGCVSSYSGILYNVQAGDSPRRPCKGRRRNDQQITWTVQGPQGPQGPEGAQGPQGPAGPPGDSGSDASQFVYVGPSSASHLGGEGIATMNQACALTFAGSRMCTSQEIMKTPEDVLSANNDLPGNLQWVRPSLVAVRGVDDGTGAGRRLIAVDASGLQGPLENLVCGDARGFTLLVPWSAVTVRVGCCGYQSLYGLAMLAGELQVAACGVPSKRIACCAPAQEVP